MSEDVEDVMDEPVFGVASRTVTRYLRSLSDEELMALRVLCGGWIGVARRYGVAEKTVRNVVSQREALRGIRLDRPKRRGSSRRSLSLRVGARNYLTLADLHHADPGEFERWVELICQGTPLCALGPPALKRVGQTSIQRRGG